MRRLWMFICLCSLLASGCEKDDLCNCLESTGPEVTETRILNDFDKMELNNNVDIILTPDTVTYATLTCGKNLADGIKTEVTDGRLIIKNINRCNWLRDFRNKFTLDVHYKTLNYIVNYGSGNLSCSDTLRESTLLVENWNGTGELSFLVNGDEIYFKLHTGPGDILASGKSRFLYIYTAGNGYMKTANLESEIVYVSTKSTGDCEVFPTVQLSVSIEYQGNIYYKGNPGTIHQQVTGSGSLIPF